MARKAHSTCWLCGCNAPEGGDHLELLKRMRIRISEAVFNEDIPARDLSSLTRRLADLAKEIDTLEERAAKEGKQTSVRSNSRASEDEGDDDPNEV